MNYHYVATIVALVLLSPLHAMELQKTTEQLTTEQIRFVTGKIYIDGPIAYGPEEYYENFDNQYMYDHSTNVGFSAQSKQICVNPYEPLIQVSVLINDTDESNNKVERFWTKNDSDYVLDSKGREIENEQQISLPSIIERLERERYKQNYCTDVVPARDAWEIKEKYFPSYLPLRLFRECKQADTKMKFLFLISNITVLLHCIANPHEEGTFFKDNLENRLQSFIKAPRYFQWRHETCCSSTRYQPIAKLMERGLIAHQPLPAKTQDLMRMCHKSSALCSPHCSMDPNSYEHGNKGQENVARIKEMFSYFLTPQVGMAFDGFNQVPGVFG